MPFSQEDHEILAFFERNKGQLFSIKDISRNMDRQRFREDRTWARPHLLALWSQGHLQRDEAGYFFIAPPPE